VKRREGKERDQLHVVCPPFASNSHVSKCEVQQQLSISIQSCAGGHDSIFTIPTRLADTVFTPCLVVAKSVKLLHNGPT